MRDLETALKDLRGVAASQDSEALSAITFELETLVLTVDQLPDRFVEQLSRLLEDQAFLEVTDSWKLVKCFYDLWGQLTNEQRERLRPVLMRSFDKYGDWMGAFVTAEILGEKFADERALVNLTELAQTAKLPERAAVPHGMELVAKTSSDERLRALAIRRLEELASSSIKEVSDEAVIALTNAGRRPP
jgi:hypothetical protein